METTQIYDPIYITNSKFWNYVKCRICHAILTKDGDTIICLDCGFKHPAIKLIELCSI
ncbi:hypothetical protein LCGC14_0175810 [marine sediment metagenome]|uniref:Uncharacterized protein n=1 Tax=marine sediment metagenome TaxID=412755 RepID=A0A0F9V7L9_9ZZZZ